MRIIKFDTKAFTVTEVHYIQGVSDVWSNEQALGYRQEDGWLQESQGSGS